MTRLLQQAIEAARSLPASEQDAIAASILAEIEDEERWSTAFASSQDLLERLAREAVEEHRAGRTRPLDVDGM